MVTIENQRVNLTSRQGKRPRTPCKTSIANQVTDIRSIDEVDYPIAYIPVSRGIQSIGPCVIDRCCAKNTNPG